MKGSAARGLHDHTRSSAAPPVRNKCIVDSTGTERKWKEEEKLLLVYMAAAAAAAWRGPINFVSVAAAAPPRRMKLFYRSCC